MPPARAAMLRASTWVLLISLALCALRIPLAEVPDLLDPPGRLLPLWPQSLLWLGMGLIALLGARRGYLSLQRASGARRVFTAGRRQPDVEADPRSPTLALVLFVVVHVALVVLSGFRNNMRGMLTGWFVIERKVEPASADRAGDRA